jgi:hypothetical protein
MSRSSRIFALLPAFALLSGIVSAKDRHKAEPAPQDEIQVVAHLPAAGSNISRFLCTEHRSQNLLYAEGDGGKFVRLIDVTDVQHPELVADLSSGLVGTNDIVAAAGTAALISDKQDAKETTPAKQVFRVMSFADPAHPVVKQEIAGVTAMQRDADRGLIFLANADGLWILQQHIAPDPRVEKEWEHMMLDNR